ncbi:MBL fold metallo-hydrolase [Hymenobacter humi]|uniref:MBL fold metallo-hydrolase n=1 Tax=Hymenobacter humi TaxID=1411620 RepID=A0ABW2U7Z7_9BACT
MQGLDVDDPSTPYLMNWRWLHVPGHAPGRLAFFREADRVLIGADAFATCHHDSVPAVLLGRPKISRAGTPFNYDWEAARRSVQLLAGLEPKAIGCGHGPVIIGPEAAAGLHEANNYPVPAHGRYVHEAARTNANGVEHLPLAPKDRLPMQAAVIGASVLAAGVAWLLTGGRRRSRKPRPASYASQAQHYRSGVGS